MVASTTTTSVETGLATLLTNTSVEMAGNITDYGTWSTLTAGFFLNGQRKEDGSSSPAAPPYPNFIQGWNARDAANPPTISSTVVTVDTTEGYSQVVALGACQSQAGTGIAVSGGFTVLINRVSEDVFCGGNGMRYLLGVRMNGSAAASFTATYTPGTLYGVNIYVAEYANTGLAGQVYTKVQNAAEPFITETIPAQSVLFAYATETDNVAATTFINGNDRYRACNVLPGGSVCIAAGDKENGDLSTPASVTVQPHYAAPHTVDFNAVELTFISPPEAFTVTVSGLTECAQYRYRAFVSATGGSSPIAYGAERTFFTGGTCPFDVVNWLMLATFLVFVVGGSAVIAAWRLRR